jgi:hypothetical protein
VVEKYYLKISGTWGTSRRTFKDVLYTKSVRDTGADSLGR